MKKKLLLLLILLIPFITKADFTETVCVGENCFSETNSVINGDTGTATYDHDTHTITLNNFSYTGHGYNYQYLTYKTGGFSTYYALIYSDLLSEITINVIGNNNFTLTDLNISLGSQDSVYYCCVNFSRSYNVIGQNKENDKLNFTIENQSQIIRSFYIFNTSSGANTLDNFKNVEMNISTPKNLAKSIDFARATNVTIDNCLINQNIDELDISTMNDFYTCDYSGFFASNILTIKDSELNTYIKGTNQEFKGFSAKDYEVTNSKIKIETEQGSKYGFSYFMYSGSSKSIFNYKDSELIATNTRYGIYSFSSISSDITFDNTIFDLGYIGIVSGYYDEIDTDAETIPTITLKNYTDKSIIYTLKGETKLLDPGRTVYSYPKTVDKGKVKTELEEYMNYIDLSTEDQNSLDIGSDITLSVTQDIIEPTASVTSLVTDKNVLEYFDINFVKEVNNIKNNVTELKKEIEVEIPLKDSYKSAKGNRTYKVLRIHENEVDELNTEIKGDKIVFKTDKFSTYVLTYTDTTNNPKTGDSLTNNIILAIISVIVLIIVLIVYKKKK